MRDLSQYDLVEAGNQYYFDAQCRICDHRLDPDGHMDGNSWVHYFECPSCGSLTLVSEGDKMGGQFDHFEVYKPR